MKRPQNSNKEWDNKLWAAKTFGWKPDEVDELPAYEMNMLIKAWNKEQNNIARQQRLAKRKRR